MKKFFLLAGLFIAGMLRAQTVNEVLDKYITAMGGLDAFANIKTMKYTGSLAVQGMDLPMTTVLIADKAMRLDVDAMGQKIVSVYNNGKGWKLNPFAGAPEKTEVTGTELNDYKTQTWVINGLMRYKTSGDKVELLPAEKVEGVPCQVVKLTSTSGKITTYYISDKDYLLIKSVSDKEIQGQTVSIETFYSNMKEFGGAKFAMTRDQKIEGQTFQTVKLNTIELNVPVDDKIFEN